MSEWRFNSIDGNSYYEHLKENNWGCSEFLEGDIIENLKNAFINDGSQQVTNNISYSTLWDYKKHKFLQSTKFFIGTNTKYLSIGHDDRFTHSIGLSNRGVSDEESYISYGDRYLLDYPKNTVVDIPYDDNFFDFVISDQVLEHVDSNPFDACDEMYRVTKKGGYNIHSTVWQWPSHHQTSYGDFWRFSKEGLFKMFARSGFDIVAIEHAGNFLWSLILSLWPYFWDYWWYRIPDEPDSLLHKLAMTVDVPFDHFVVREFGIHTNWIVCRK